MIAVCVTFRIKDDRLPEFMTAMKKQAGDTLRKEPLCHRFDICGLSDWKSEVFLYELYDDLAAFRLHLQTDHFRAFDAQVADMVSDKTVRVFGEVINNPRSPEPHRAVR